jgi:hypothetical protein
MTHTSVRIRPAMIVLLIAVVLMTACAPAAAPVPAPALPQTVTSTDGSFSLNYPEGWSASADYGITLATSPNLVENPNPQEAGQFVTSLQVLSPNDIDTFRSQSSEFSTIVKSDPPTPGEIVQFALTLLLGEDEQVDTGLTIAGLPAARATFTTPTIDEQRIDASLIVLQTENNAYLMLLGLAAPGQIEKFQSTLNAIAETIQYNGGTN